jgi:ERCC4-type nuclease
MLEELGVDVEVTPLNTGDYAVGADTIVERKQISDLHGAIINGRFWGQIGGLRAACSFPYLLVEGENLDRGPLSKSSVRGACLAVVDLGVALIRSTHTHDSALWLHRLAVRRQRFEPPPDRPLYSQRPKPKTSNGTSEAVLAAIPGISAATAQALLSRFGSLSAVLAASPTEWRGVAGVGPARADALSSALHHLWQASSGLTRPAGKDST